MWVGGWLQLNVLSVFAGRTLWSFYKDFGEIVLHEKIFLWRRILLNFILSGSLIKKVVMPPEPFPWMMWILIKENSLELLQRSRRDRRILLNFILSGSLIKKVVMPPGAVSLDDVDLDQLVDFVLNCARKGRECPADSLNYLTALCSFICKNNAGSNDDFFLATNPELSVSQFHTTTRVNNAAADLVLGLPSFATAIGDDDLCQTAYEILLAAAGASGGLIVPSKDKKKEKKSRLMKKLGRSKSENVMTQSQHLSGLVSLLEITRVQMEIETVSGILRWVPVSPQQTHRSSIVEVYRIVEETVDQFFALEVPMRPGELGSLFCGIDNAFQVYAKTVLDKIANKEDIVPPVPILTRHFVCS
ncbi:hypothetical protein MTR67_008851 [Solanum verrucosum]|uniref:PATROL1-like C-terminal domain-containing protein n=1 Tax=Solanum verrucosum TaxID=315347 RepID=A0AAF0Q2C3_SOLVR|nr:hypothetical protein MTR67_008851 [Solanum verrucosum]